MLKESAYSIPGEETRSVKMNACTVEVKIGLIVQNGFETQDSRIQVLSEAAARVNNTGFKYHVA